MGKTLCFTGHRPHKLNGYEPNDNRDLLYALRDEIIDAIENQGVTTFISGMALGVDMWAARIVLKQKETYPQIKLVAAVPCDKQWSRWIPKSIKEWEHIISKADKVHYVSKEPYTPRCMNDRNEWMVDHSDIVLAVWDGSNSGTGNCVKYARKKGLDISRLDPVTLDVTSEG